MISENEIFARLSNVFLFFEMIGESVEVKRNYIFQYSTSSDVYVYIQ